MVWAATTFPGSASLLRVVSLVVSLVVSWLLFTWIIARLPRESVSFRSAVRAGLLAAVVFEIFKQVGVDLPARWSRVRRVRRSARCSA